MTTPSEASTGPGRAGSPPQTVPPSPPADKPSTKSDDPRDARIADLEAKLAARDTAAPGVTGQEMVMLKVEPPHESMTHASVTIGNEFIAVPRWLLPALETAAADSGVTLTQEA